MSFIIIIIIICTDCICVYLSLSTVWCFDCCDHFTWVLHNVFDLVFVWRRWQLRACCSIAGRFGCKTKTKIPSCQWYELKKKKWNEQTPLPRYTWTLIVWRSLVVLRYFGCPIVGCGGMVGRVRTVMMRTTCLFFDVVVVAVVDVGVVSFQIVAGLYFTALLRIWHWCRLCDLVNADGVFGNGLATTFSTWRCAVAIVSLN